MNKLISNLASTGIVLVASIAITYFYEKSKPASDYYEYYGNVTTQEAFHFPERLSSYTFGKSHIGDTLELDFVNKLWCSPLGSRLPPRLLATRYKHFDAFQFANKLPPEVVVAIGTHNALSRIGEYDANKIREQEYFAWNMDTIRPYEDSVCFISAEATSYSFIFGIPKITVFNGNNFEYYTSLRKHTYSEPYSEWSAKQKPSSGPTTLVIVPEE